MPKQLPGELLELQLRVEEAARGYGLSFYQTCYEILDYDEINMVSSYMGFPVRYPHWKWGMDYERLSKNYEYGMGKIYELVINNDPCYAYLLESNSYVDQKLVMCHVTGHNDFFKNNFAFAHTNRKMMDEMANHATRIRRYMDWYGVDKVENFIDKVLSLDNLIDCHAPFINRGKMPDAEEDEPKGESQFQISRLPADKEYMDRYVNPDDFIELQKQRQKEKLEKAKKFPKEPARDVLKFLMQYAPLLRWQRDIMDMLWKEAQYFVPQAMTKIMNEGWASYWHAKLMTEKVMEPSELIDFSDRHAGVVAMRPGQLNPYKLGLELYRDIEDRWNKGRFGSDWDNCENMAERRNWNKQLGIGREKIFQVRKLYSDVMFIDEFFTLEFCKQQGFFAYGYDKKRQEFIIESKDFREVKNKLLQSLTNLGQPHIRVLDGNFENRAELLLEHKHEGVDLDVQYSKETLKNIYAIWTRPVHILSALEERHFCLSFDGESFKEKLIAN
jgi:stage V sporulation protein R